MWRACGERGAAPLQRLGSTLVALRPWNCARLACRTVKRADGGRPLRGGPLVQERHSRLTVWSLSPLIPSSS